jgi:hypothetical protein
MSDAATTATERLNPSLPRFFDVGLRISGNHAHQHTLSDTGAGKDAHPLALSATEQAIDGLDAEIHRFCNSASVEGVDGIGVDRVVVLAVDRSLIVYGIS